MTALLPAMPARQHPVAHFRHNIDALLLRLNDEFEKTKDVQGEVAAFNERGFFSRWTGSITTQNDTDLAGMIASLGGSLSVTQEVLRCLLQINAEKNQALKGFHAAIVDKLQDLESNDSAFDSSVRENFTLLLEHLKEQVEDKLAQANQVEEHARTLETHHDQLSAFQRDLAQQQRQYQRLVEQLDELETNSETHTRQVNQCESELAAVKNRAEGIERKLAALEQQLAENTLHCNTLARTMRKKRPGFRDLLLFASAAGVIVLGWLQFAHTL